ncbi:(2Fe-2S)-binding protein [Thalassotalea insulae]|uniref:(2Fe-2S)-binding protein n=1 Tax=Thalassotalea insulae TaxID=2056778 RepID=A0ABQ6GMT2_9GAMM|nr:(2Fe-2S)-binding protein [Thalassotalea insulae]GLX77232.1 (2Fe-2S)-binding protein [Thalassotalea insulae]
MSHSEKTFRFNVNGRVVEINSEPAQPLLWVIREQLKLKGTRYGCGVSSCGVCTVHVNGQAVRSCVYPISQCQGSDITTIEGLSESANHPVQNAWIEANVPQCGYCQSGQIMQAAALFEGNPTPNDEQIAKSMSRVICRCGTYPRIKKAMQIVVKQLDTAKS